jgi:hydrogenase nickel incorporation protein HypB
MCNSCGCGVGETRIDGTVPAHRHDSAHHDHSHHDHTNHNHSHSHESAETQGYGSSSDHHVHQDEGHLHYGQGPAHAHAPGLSQSRMVQIETDILAKNAEYAQQNRMLFLQRNILTLNLVSSPGSGKTTLLTETLKVLSGSVPSAVIEGDQETANDADRIRETGVQAVQINTGKGCHLDAHMVGHAIEKFDFDDHGILFIENVGNLVCPAGFDLGEAHKVVILSVTEGEDKPIKYPDMFHAADVMILNKVDLLPHLKFDVEKCIEYARQVNPTIDIISCSTYTGEGMADWLHWLERKRNMMLDEAIEPMSHRLEKLKQLRHQPLFQLDPSVAAHEK